MDLWGRPARAEDAVRAELLGAEENRRVVAQTVVAEAPALYFEIESIERGLAISFGLIDNFKRNLRLVRRRYERGLAGVVVNDSLVLIDRANRYRNEGYNAHDAIVRAGCIRLRAILLTSLTTFAGLTPMMLERSIQAQFLIPMAVSLGFGVLFATAITLLLVPCGYMFLEDIYNFVRQPGTSRGPVGAKP